VILALSSLTPRLLYSLTHAIGLAKCALAGDPQSLLSNRTNWRTQQEEYEYWLLQHLGAEDQQLRSLAASDLTSARQKDGFGPRRRLALSGLASMARMLVDGEPHRVRWALQSLPYGIAKRVRSIMAQTSNPTPGQLRLDSILVRAAWERLARQNPGIARHPEHAPRKDEVRDVD
jgi:hypothetical protein